MSSHGASAVVQEQVCYFRYPFFPGLFQRATSHVRQRAPAEFRHDCATFVERIPEAAGAIASLSSPDHRPFASEHALADTIDTLRITEMGCVSDGEPKFIE